MNKSIKTTLAIGMKKDINESEIHQNLFFCFLTSEIRQIIIRSMQDVGDSKITLMGESLV